MHCHNVVDQCFGFTSLSLHTWVNVNFFFRLIVLIPNPNSHNTLDPHPLALHLYGGNSHMRYIYIFCYFAGTLVYTMWNVVATICLFIVWCFSPSSSSLVQKTFFRLFCLSLIGELLCIYIAGLADLSIANNVTPSIDIIWKEKCNCLVYTDADARARGSKRPSTNKSASQRTKLKCSINMIRAIERERKASKQTKSHAFHWNMRSSPLKFFMVLAISAIV